MLVNRFQEGTGLRVASQPPAAAEETAETSGPVLDQAELGGEAETPGRKANLGWGITGAVAGAIPIIGGVSTISALVMGPDSFAEIKNPILRTGAYVGSMAVAVGNVFSVALPFPINLGFCAANAALGGYAWSKLGN